MSVFRVKLHHTGAQGQLDRDPSTATAVSAGQGLGTPFASSIQRTIYVAGPGRTYRKLVDGQTFSDCNYWKRFASDQIDAEHAFIEVVTDDGSVYSDIASENTFPKVYDMAITQGTAFTDNVIDILSDTGGHAVFVQIANQGTAAVRVRVNGTADAIFDLGASETQVFNAGDLSVTKLEFINSVSGGGPADVQVLLSVKSVCNS